MAVTAADIQPRIHLFEFLIRTISFILLRMEHFRDICISMLNLFAGRLRGSLLPKIPNRDLTGKTCLVTGGNSGIGLSIAKSMAERGCKVLITSRSKEKGEAAAEEIRDHTTSLPRMMDESDASKEIKANIEVKQLDNASFASVRALVSNLDESNTKLDYLFLNAGFPGAASNDFTEDTHELTYQSNFLASFLMTHMLLSRNLLSADARVVLTASTGQYGGLFSSDFKERSEDGVLEPGFHGPPYTKSGLVKLNPSSRYANTKLMQVVFAKMLQRHFDALMSRPESDEKQLGGPGMSAHVFTPSYCATPIFAKTDSPSPFNDPLFWFLVVSTKIAVPVEEGAATGVFLAMKDGLDGGGYWDRCVRRSSNADVMSEAMKNRLWRRWCADAQVEWDLP